MYRFISDEHPILSTVTGCWSLAFMESGTFWSYIGERRLLDEAKIDDKVRNANWDFDAILRCESLVIPSCNSFTSHIRVVR